MTNTRAVRTAGTVTITRNDKSYTLDTDGAYVVVYNLDGTLAARAADDWKAASDLVDAVYPTADDKDVEIVQVVDGPGSETVYLCPHCDDEIDPDELGGRVYECGNCGTFVAEEGDGNRCPDCNKFAAKLADRSCPSCEEPIEDGADLPEKMVYRASDGTVHDTATDAVVWDLPSERFERERKTAENKDRSAQVLADHYAQRAASVARLRAAVALPSTPHLAYYDETSGFFDRFESTSASLTPAEVIACCGVATAEEAEPILVEFGIGHFSSFWADAQTVGIDADDLSTLLERLAARS